MSRASAAILLGIAALALAFLSHGQANGGCHGGCIGHATPAASPSLSGSNLLDVATTGVDPATRLELYSITLVSGQELDSLIFAGEATAFYVESGTIAFVVGADAAADSVRVVADSGSTPIAVGDLEPELTAGDALFVDAQAQDLEVRYRNDDAEDARLLIASAVPST